MTKPALTSSERVLAFREAGNVRRCHVVPHHGEYTVGKHSFDAVSLLLVLKPDASRNLIIAMLHHDCAERWVGDMPAPAKWYDEELGDAYERAEQRVEKEFEINLPELTQEEYNWLLAIDRLELWLWCHDQTQLGNNHVYTFFPALDGWFQRNAGTVPPEVSEFKRTFDWKRMEERR